jgi:hypothetical protein
MTDDIISAHVVAAMLGLALGSLAAGDRDSCPSGLLVARNGLGHAD